MSLPTTGDLNQFLTDEATFTVKDVDRLEFYLADAYEELQRWSGIRPFEAVVQTRKFEMARGGGIGYRATPMNPDRILRFDTPIVGDHSKQVPTITRGTTLLVADDDYWLRPNNAPLRGLPYTWAEFAGATQPAHKGVTVLAAFGYSESMPPAAWGAVLRFAAGKFVRAFKQGRFLEAITWHEGDQTESYAAKLIETLGDAWIEEAECAMKRYAMGDQFV